MTDDTDTLSNASLELDMSVLAKIMLSLKKDDHLLLD